MVNPKYSDKIQSNYLQAKIFSFFSFFLFFLSFFYNMGFWQVWVPHVCQNLTTHFQITGPLWFKRYLFSAGLFSLLNWFIIEVKALHWASAVITQVWDYWGGCSPPRSPAPRSTHPPQGCTGVAVVSMHSPLLLPPQSQCSCTSPWITNL